MAGSVRNRLWTVQFAVMWGALALSSLGDAGFGITFMWLALRLSGSPAVAGSVLAIEGLPLLLLGPVAGVLVDRFHKRTVLISSALIRLCIAGAIYGLAVHDALRMWHLYGAAVVLSVAGVAFGPAVRVALRLAVDSKLLPAANSSTQAAQQFMQIVGASLAGVLVSALGAEVTSGLFGCVFGAVAISLCALRLFDAVRPSGLSPRQLLADMGQGFRYILSTRELLFLTLLTFGISLILAPANVVLPVYSEQRLGAGALGFGLMEAGIGVGMFAGSILVGIVGDRLSHVWGIAVGLAGMALAFSALALSQWLAVAVGLVMLLGASVPFIQVPLITRLQRMVDPSIQGRVFSTMNTLSKAAPPLGAAAAGAVLLSVSVSAVFLTVGVCLLLLAVGWRAVGLRWSMPEPLSSAPSGGGTD